jgi:hypothetical protein
MVWYAINVLGLHVTEKLTENVRFLYQTNAVQKTFTVASYSEKYCVEILLQICSSDKAAVALLTSF